MKANELGAHPRDVQRAAQERIAVRNAEVNALRAKTQAHTLRHTSELLTDQDREACSFRPSWRRR
jgi:hypothetical protein